MILYKSGVSSGRYKGNTTNNIPPGRKPSDVANRHILCFRQEKPPGIINIQYYLPIFTDRGTPLKYPIANTHNDMMQNPDYFERTRSRLHPKKYRFYFFDYLYYCGDRWSKRNSRVWGSGVIFNYWTFCIWGPIAFWTRLNGIHLFSESIDVTIVFAGMLLPFVCTRLRYRKDRVSAIRHHYRRSAWRSIIPPRLVVFGWFIILLLEVIGAKLCEA